MQSLVVPILKLRPNAVIPVYHAEGDAGFDLYACQDTIVPAFMPAIIPTGLAFAVPDGFEMQIRLRSGAALTTPIIVANAPGTIDSGYRGEVGIIVRNLSGADWLVREGERVAQGLIAPVYKAVFTEMDELPPSERGDRGFGSSGFC